ncbi:MAG: type I-E CRISPR-associated protein Cse2/CasB [Actinomycetales bacterium]
MNPTTRQDSLSDAVTKAVLTLQRGYLDNRSDSVRELAVLRRGTGGGAMDAWELIYRYIPDELTGSGDEITTTEMSFATSLGLFALHQQGRSLPMFRSQFGLGTAVRRLILRQPSAEDATMRRFKTLGSASTWNGRVHHLRGVISQLRSEQVPLDYGQLARDLVLLQGRATADAVRQRWARDVHRSQSADPHGLADPTLDSTDSLTTSNINKQGEDQ